MRGNFKYIIIFLLLFTIPCFAEEKRKISIVKSKNVNSSDINGNIIRFLVDSAQEKIAKKYDNITILFDDEKYIGKTIIQITSEIIINNQDGFFYIDLTNDNNLSILNVKFINGFNEIFYDGNYKVVKDFGLSEGGLDAWYEIFYKSIDKLLLKKVSGKKKANLIFLNTKANRDFPLISISLNALSLKMYFDSRTSSKLFSMFPIDIRLTFFPLKYFECGTFIKFNVNDNVYKYYDNNKNINGFYDSSFDFSYGIFCGMSYFSDIIHYSIGAQFYNLYYDLNNNYKYLKTDDINSYFLPQFSIYQKLDIKLLKYIYFSLFFCLKTLPLFNMNNKYFYSNPFSYDFVNLEFSFIGISIII